MNDEQGYNPTDHARKKPDQPSHKITSHGLNQHRTEAYQTNEEAECINLRLLFRGSTWKVH